jgi:hypothetical protein
LWISTTRGYNHKVRSGLTTKLLIGVSGVSRFSHFVQQRKSDEDPLGRTSVPIFDIKRDANVEAAEYPLPQVSQATMVGLTESPVV